MAHLNNLPTRLFAMTCLRAKYFRLMPALMDVSMLEAVALVACGGAVGAVLRFGMGQLVPSGQFPWSTFAVNILGAFLVALIFFSFSTEMSDAVRLFLFVGLFGAFTTMSTFTLETTTLFFDGRVWDAGLNFVLNAGVTVLGAVAGQYAALLLA